MLIAFESRKRSATPYKTSPLNIALPFSFIDYYRKHKVCLVVVVDTFKYLTVTYIYVVMTGFIVLIQKQKVNSKKLGNIRKTKVLT